MRRRNGSNGRTPIAGIPLLAEPEPAELSTMPAGEEHDAPPSSPLGRLERSWKALVVVGAILAAGWGGAMYLNRYAEAADVSAVRDRAGTLERRADVTDARLDAIMRSLDRIENALGTKP